MGTWTEPEQGIVTSQDFVEVSEPSPGSQVIESERRTARMLWVAETEVKEEQDYAPVLQPNTGEREFTLLTPVAS